MAELGTSHDALLDAATAKLSEAGLTIVHVEVEEGSADYGWEARLEVGYAGHVESYVVALKTRIAPASVNAIPLSPERRLLIAPHISDAVADLLRQRNIHYVDSVGNMYLNWAGLLLDVRGRRGPAAPHPGEPGRPLRSFKPGGLRVVSVLLADPGFIDQPYRVIAEAGGVSLGTVHWVLKELEGAGYATMSPRRLYRTRDLLDRWVEAYALNLQPRLTLAHFDAPDPEWWRVADDAVRAAGAQWGGETAAHHLIPRLRPQRAVLYAPAVPNKLAVEHRFRKAGADGNVEIRQRFWRFAEDSLTVPTPLIYADLIASADPRLAEAATELRRNDALLGRLDRG